MKARYLILFVVALCGLTAKAQETVDKKLSLSSHMFLMDQQRAATDTIAPSAKGSRKAKGYAAGSGEGRAYANIEVIDGREYISCFLRLKDNTDTKAVEALGVRVQCSFGKELITASVPVDNFMKVAELGEVTRINVATPMKLSTAAARKDSHTLDALTHSTFAERQGLIEGYDGTGVVLGIVDTGVDFQHIAFKDKDGNSRIARAFVYDGDEEHIYSDPAAIAALTTDNDEEDHGTHTASTAGGSSVIVDAEQNVTVTDDHAAATYGGMAPGATLYLAGLQALWNTNLCNAIKKIVEYADSVGKPVVVSNSWGSHGDPHDGTGQIAECCESLFGESHPNRILLFAASNDAGNRLDGGIGGYHTRGTASATKPFGSIIRSKNGPTFISTYLTSVWTRTPFDGNLSVSVYQLNKQTGEIVDAEYDVTKNEAFVFDNYTIGSVGIYFDSNKAGKKQVIIYSADDDAFAMQRDYALAFEIRTDKEEPVELDAWAAGECYYVGDEFIRTEGHTWTTGSDDMSVEDEATIPCAISVGAYTSKQSYKNYKGESFHYTAFTQDDIAPFSSYATAEESPLGKVYPDICAPGAVVVSGVNHFNTGAYSYYGTNNLVVNNAENPYGLMCGTSMATPAAAGIVALWLQRAVEKGQTLTPNQVKTIMRNTAIHDRFTATHAKEFGQSGKINALGGLVDAWPAPYYALMNQNDNKAAIREAAELGTNAFVVLKDRTLYKDGDWNTLCLPFNVADNDPTDGISFSGTPLEGATAMELDVDGTYNGYQTGFDATDGTLHLYFKEANTIEAAKPYLIKWAEGTNLVNPVFDNVAVSNAPYNDVTSQDGNVSFMGVYYAGKAYDDFNDRLFVGTNNTLYYPKNGATLNAHRAYFQLNNDITVGSPESAVKTFALSFGEGNATDGIKVIDNLKIDNLPSAASDWYDLNGRRLAKKPARKGIYIHNGRKTVITNTNCTN